MVRGGFLSGPGISPVYDQASSAVDGLPSPHEFFLGLREEIGLPLLLSIQMEKLGVEGRSYCPFRTTLLSLSWWSTSARLLRKGN